ncbi:MAG: PD-(D/E)XK nuclease family protein [Lachnospiraceae bacterium]|nr:PD-(D/E)XK nuclease family protein [Lachnospiraceae bacterium]
MALSLILGSDAGKNREIMLRQMLAQSADASTECFFFVPEQANLDAERSLCALHEGGCITNIDIVSFRRLGYRLVDELGDRIPPVLDEIGKSLLLKKVMTEHAKDMAMFGGKINKTGFIEETKSLLSELVSYEVTPEKLREMSEATADTDVMLSNKLAELADVFTWFRMRCGETRIMEVDIYRAMKPLVKESKRLRGSVLYFDGYTGFTPTQLSLVAELLKVCRDVVITVTIDPAEYGRTDGADCFRISRETIAALAKLATETGHKVLAPTVTDASDDERDPALAKVAFSLFRKGAAPYTGDSGDAVVLTSAPDCAEEVRRTVCEIAGLIRRDHAPCDAIGVVCGDIPTYAELLRKEMQLAEIPFFIDLTSDVKDNALIEYIRSLLAMIDSDMKTEEVMRWLKNPIQNFPAERIAFLENFLLARGIRGWNAWKRGFTGDYGGRRETMALDCAVFAEELRERLEPLRDALAGDTDLRAKTEALYAFLVKEDVYRRMLAISEELVTERVPWHLRRSKEYASVYRAVVDLFDRMYELMPDTPISLREYRELCDAGFAELRLGVIPPETNCVMIGDRKRSRISRVQYLFFLGMNEGVVPGSGHPSILLNEKEREILKEKGLLLADTPKELMDSEEFYVLLNLQKPTRKLTVSWSLIGNDGSDLHESYIVRRIRELLGRKEKKDGADAGETTFFDRIVVDGGRRELMQNFDLAAGRISSEYTDPDELADYRALYRWYFTEGQDSPISAERLAEAEKGFFREAGISEESARKLHPAGTQFSVSRLQKYAECPFAHFLSYDLGIDERVSFEPDNRMDGQVYHAVAERVFRRIGDEMRAGGDIDDEKLMAWIEEAEREVAEDPAYECYHVNGRNRYLMQSLFDNLRFMFPHYLRQVKKGKYRFYAAEQPFDITFDQYRLVGKIDRIELAGDGDRVCIKITDYKSNTKKYNRDHADAGVTIQLPWYLRVSEKILREKGLPAVAAAAFYSTFAIGYKTGLPKDEESEKAINDETKPDGFFSCETATAGGEKPLADDRYLRLLDADVAEAGDKYRSNIVKLSVDKGKMSGNVMPEEALASMLDGVEQSVGQEISEIAGGSVAIRPLKCKDSSAKYNACEYCSYGGICRVADAVKDPSRSIKAQDEDGGNA